MSIHGWTPRGSLKNEWQKHTVDPEKLAMSMPQNEDHVSLTTYLTTLKHTISIVFSAFSDHSSMSITPPTVSPVG